MRKMIEDKLKKSSEISFNDDFKLYEERKFIIWNHIKHEKEQYIIKKEDTHLYILYLEDKDFTNPIFDFFGIWSDFSDEELTIITDAIKDIRNRISNRYIQK